MNIREDITAPVIQYHLTINIPLLSYSLLLQFNYECDKGYLKNKPKNNTLKEVDYE